MAARARWAVAFVKSQGRDLSAAESTNSTIRLSGRFHLGPNIRNCTGTSSDFIPKDAVEKYGVLLQYQSAFVDPATPRSTIHGPNPLVQRALISE
jgi:hypothetical protein